MFSPGYFFIESTDNTDIHYHIHKQRSQGDRKGSPWGPIVSLAPKQFPHSVRSALLASLPPLLPRLAP
jgi:hypothetical protein